MLFAFFILIAIQSNVFAIKFPENIENDINIASYPYSFSPKSEVPLFKIENNTLIKRSGNTFVKANFRDGVLDKNENMYYYTIKSESDWGAEKYIYGYSLNQNRIIKQIEFDNSGNYKYPISISPDSKLIVIVEDAHSVGEVNLSVIELKTGKIITTDKIYSPSVTWVDNNSLIMLEADKECDGEFCLINGISIKNKNLVAKKNKVLNIAKLSNNKNANQIEVVEYINGKVVISKRVPENYNLLKNEQLYVDQNNNSKLEIDFNLIKND